MSLPLHLEPSSAGTGWATPPIPGIYFMIQFYRYFFREGLGIEKKLKRDYSFY